MFLSPSCLAIGFSLNTCKSPLSFPVKPLLIGSFEAVKGLSTGYFSGNLPDVLRVL